MSAWGTQSENLFCFLSKHICMAKPAVEPWPHIILLNVKWRINTKNTSTKEWHQQACLKCSNKSYYKCLAFWKIHFDFSVKLSLCLVTHWFVAFALWMLALTNRKAKFGYQKTSLPEKMCFSKNKHSLHPHF